MKKLVLASTSPFRAELLGRLGLSFTCVSPECDETPLEGEPLHDLVTRLAESKARSVSAEFPESLIIGSDQVAELDGNMLGKPASHENAVRQLMASSGNRVVFHTGLCLYDSGRDLCLLDDVVYSVTFRHLSEIQIERYLRAERPYQCAGSFKSEGLGVTLFEKMQGDDPNALIGLPLIRLCDMLKQVGITLP